MSKQKVSKLENLKKNLNMSDFEDDELDMRWDQQLLENILELE